MKKGQRILGKYKVETVLHHGGQAVVARGRELGGSRIVAIKKVALDAADPCLSQRLRYYHRERQLRFNHPNIVDPIDSGEDVDQPYIIFEYIDGENLSDRLSTCGAQMNVDTLRAVFGKLAAALAVVHRQEIVHRDLTPGNILIDSCEEPHLIDFGICRDLRQAPGAQEFTLAGTVPYMSPEQIMCPERLGPGSDLFSYGVLLYQCLTGVHPFAVDTDAETAVNICQRDPTPPSEINPDVPEDLDRIVARLLKKEPDQRFASAEDVLQDLAGREQAAVALRSCPYCGHTLQCADAAAARYCDHCGEALSPQTRDAARCIACGAAAGEGLSCRTCGLPFDRSDPRLVFVAGPLSGLSFRLPDGTYAVGRQQLAPSDPLVSRRQFTVTCAAGIVSLIDGAATNRTYVSGRVVDSPTRLCPDSQVFFAGNSAVYRNLF